MLARGEWWVSSDELVKDRGTRTDPMTDVTLLLQCFQRLSLWQPLELERSLLGFHIFRGSLLLP